MKRKRENVENDLNEKKKRKINKITEGKEDFKNKKLKDLSERIEKCPNGYSYFLRGIHYSWMEEKQKLAFDDFNMAIKLDPKNADYYCFRGDLYERFEQYDLALQDYSQMIKLDPSYYTSYSIRGDFYKKRKQYDLALQDYSQAIKLDPCVSNYINRGGLYKILKQNDLALQDYSQVIKLGQNFEENVLSENSDEEIRELFKLRKKHIYESYINLSMLYNEKNNNLLSIKYETIAKGYLDDEVFFYTEYSGSSRRERVEKLKKKIFIKDISKW